MLLQRDTFSGKGRALEKYSIAMEYRERQVNTSRGSTDPSAMEYPDSDKSTRLSIFMQFYFFHQIITTEYSGPESETGVTDSAGYWLVGTEVKFTLPYGVRSIWTTTRTPYMP